MDGETVFYALKEFLQIEGCRIKGNFPRLDLFDVQKLVYQGQESFRLFKNNIQVFLLVMVDSPADHLTETDDTVQGGSHLVADIRKENGSLPDWRAWRLPWHRGDRYWPAAAPGYDP